MMMLLRTVPSCSYLRFLPLLLLVPASTTLNVALFTQDATVAYGLRPIPHNNSSSLHLNEARNEWHWIKFIRSTDMRLINLNQMKEMLCTQIELGTQVVVLWKLPEKMAQLFLILGHNSPLLIISVEEPSGLVVEVEDESVRLFPKEDIRAFIFQERLAEPDRTIFLREVPHLESSNYVSKPRQCWKELRRCYYVSTPPLNRTSVIKMLIHFQRLKVEHLIYSCSTTVVREFLSVIDEFALGQDFSTHVVLRENNDVQGTQNNSVESQDQDQHNNLNEFVESFPIIFMYTEVLSETHMVASFRGILSHLTKHKMFDANKNQNVDRSCWYLADADEKWKMHKRNWTRVVNERYKKWIRQYYKQYVAVKLESASFRSSGRPSVVATFGDTAQVPLTQQPLPRHQTPAGRKLLTVGAVRLEPFVIVEAPARRRSPSPIPYDFFQNDSSSSDASSSVISSAVASANCVQQVRCLHFRHATVSLSHVEQVLTQNRYSNVLLESNPAPRDYDYVCCHGIAVTLLEKLAHDLAFDFLLYVAPEEVIVENNNSSSTPLPNLQHLSISERTEYALLKDNRETKFLIGAIGMTYQQSRHLTFSYPFFTSSHAVLVNHQVTDSMLGAVFQPFYLTVWIGIFICATVTAIAMGLYEWNSPFGLNPSGRQRQQNYTIASALNSVWALLFGHTIRTKTPKSWPVKVLQNFWAASCICVVAMYTANMTVFLTGLADSKTDVELANQTLVMRRESDIPKRLMQNDGQEARILRDANTKLVDNIKEAQILFLNKSANLFVEEKAILDYFRESRALCETRLKHLPIGMVQYSFLFPRRSALEIQISQSLLKYEDSGYLEFLQSNYYSKYSFCSAKHAFRGKDFHPHEGYGIKNMAGLFVAMGIGLAVALIILCLEHLLFQCMVPYWRSLPQDSWWKSSNIIIFISQRLHRIIHSERLIQPTEYTREMLDIVKKRQFSRIFQKENISKPLPPTHRASLAKITVFDISSEMLKLRRESISEERDDEDLPASLSVSTYQILRQKVSNLNKNMNPPLERMEHLEEDPSHSSAANSHSSNDELSEEAAVPDPGRFKHNSNSSSTNRNARAAAFQQQRHFLLPHPSTSSQSTPLLLSCHDESVSSSSPELMRYNKLSEKITNANSNDHHKQALKRSASSHDQNQLSGSSEIVTTHFKNCEPLSSTLSGSHKQCN